MIPNYDSPTELKSILDERGFSMQKKFGQNFLINPSARKTLVDSLDLEENMNVWEVGPGLGALTTQILSKNTNLTVFEIDRGFADFLKDEIQSEFPGKLKIVRGDFLKTWKNELETVVSNKVSENGKISENGKFPERFFGNLPYNVAATIIADTISNQTRFDKCVFTVQKEVAMRICAKPGTENYSSFSVLCQWAYDVKNVIDLSGASFWPRPNVDSRAVKMTKKQNFPNCENPKLFLTLVRTIFSLRRKTIKNNLNQLTCDSEFTEKILKKANIAENLRAEALDLNTILRLCDILNEEKGGK